MRFFLVRRDGTGITPKINPAANRPKPLCDHRKDALVRLELTWPKGGAVVVTATVAGNALAPLTVSEFGDTAHVDFGGAPVQSKRTVPVNPPVGVTNKSKVELSPGWMAAEVGDAVMVKPPCGTVD